MGHTKHVRRAAAAIVAATLAGVLLPLPVEAEAWTWSLFGNGVSASGALTTTDTPDSGGFVEITSIAGSRNGVAVIGLQAAGAAIPGNPGFPVDDLLRVNGPQLTVHGFGFALADGTYSNPYFADFQSPPAYYEFFSFPPFGADSHTEESVTFLATAVPDIPIWSMLIAGFSLIGMALRGRVITGQAAPDWADR